jgi:hypothetical protein
VCDGASWAKDAATGYADLCAATIRLQVGAFLVGNLASQVFLTHLLLAPRRHQNSLHSGLNTLCCLLWYNIVIAELCGLVFRVIDLKTVSNDKIIGLGIYQICSCYITNAYMPPGYGKIRVFPVKDILKIPGVNHI